MNVSAPGISAVDVWNVLVTSITGVGSIGEVLDDLTAAKIAFLDAAITSRAAPLAAYAYTGALANAATYVPAADTIIYMAFVPTNTTAANEWMMTDGGVPIVSAFIHEVSDGLRTIKGPIHCEGTDIGFKNNTGAQETIILRGVTVS